MASILAATAAAMPSPNGPVDTRTDDAGTPDVAAIMAVDPASFNSYQTGGLERAPMTNSSMSKRCVSSSTFTWGDTDNGGKGLLITNADSDWRGFYVYENSCDSTPYKYIWIDAGATKFISLPASFQGRVTRGVDSTNLNGSPQNLATWLEVSYDSAGVIWGDVSLIRGCDGGSLLWSLDGSGAWKGFTQVSIFASSFFSLQSGLSLALSSLRHFFKELAMASSFPREHKLTLFVVGPRWSTHRLLRYEERWPMGAEGHRE